MRIGSINNGVGKNETKSNITCDLPSEGCAWVVLIMVWEKMKRRAILPVIFQVRDAHR